MMISEERRAQIVHLGFDEKRVDCTDDSIDCDRRLRDFGCTYGLPEPSGRRTQSAQLVLFLQSCLIGHSRRLVEAKDRVLEYKDMASNL